MFSVAFESCRFYQVNRFALGVTCLVLRWKLLGLPREHQNPRAVLELRAQVVQPSPKSIIAGLVPLSFGWLEVFRLINASHRWNAVCCRWRLLIEPQDSIDQDPQCQHVIPGEKIKPLMGLYITLGFPLGVMCFGREGSGFDGLNPCHYLD